MKQIRMKRAFYDRLPLEVFDGEVIDCNGFNVFTPFDLADAEAIIHAVNNHDSMVAQRYELLSERNRTGLDIDAAIRNGVVPESHPLKSRLEMLANYHKREADLASKLNTAELTLDEAERVISELVRNGAYGLDDLLDEVGSCLRKLQDGAV